MPYYESIKVLFIHIPKTGGTSMEKFLKSKSKQTLYSSNPKNNILPVKNVSLQHQTFKTIFENRRVLKVNFREIRIITIVRNPYYRIISDLFWNKLMSIDTPPEKVFEIMSRYIKKHYDNHNLPQYKFLTLDDKTIAPQITIFKTESLTQDAIKFGFEKFPQNRANTGKESHKKYMKYLNDDSLALINDVYKKDFELFDYPCVSSMRKV